MRAILAASAALMFSVSVASACTWGMAKTADSEDAISEQSVMSTFDGTHLPPIETDEQEAAATPECAAGDADCKAAE